MLLFLSTTITTVGDGGGGTVKKLSMPTVACWQRSPFASRNTEIRSREKGNARLIYPKHLRE